MKQGIHPGITDLLYFGICQTVVILTKSTAPSRENIKWEDGNSILIKLGLNTSHPFYTGKMKLVDTAGKIDSMNRYKDHVNKKRKSNIQITEMQGLCQALRSSGCPGRQGFRWISALPVGILKVQVDKKNTVFETFGIIIA